MSKKHKRKMPPHIVLANGQWRFVKRGSKKRKSHTSIRYKKRRTRARTRRVKKTKKRYSRNKTWSVI